MKVETKSLPKSTIKLTVSLEPAEMEKYKQQASKKIQEKVKIPGFRPGQAPLDLVIKHLGQEAFWQEVLDAALTATYAQAVEEQKLHPVAYPKLQIKKQGIFWEF